MLSVRESVFVIMKLVDIEGIWIRLHGKNSEQVWVWSGSHFLVVHESQGNPLTKLPLSSLFWSMLKMHILVLRIGVAYDAHCSGKCFCDIKVSWPREYLDLIAWKKLSTSLSLKWESSFGSSWKLRKSFNKIAFIKFILEHVENAFPRFENWCCLWCSAFGKVFLW